MPIGAYLYIFKAGHQILYFLLTLDLVLPSIHLFFKFS